jgi:hypothetical protein
MTESLIPAGRLIRLLSQDRQDKRASGAKALFVSGAQRIEQFLKRVANDPEFQSLMVFHGPASEISPGNRAKLTVGIAVSAVTFEKIRAASGAPPLADVPADQDALEFELHFEGDIALDILTTKAPGKDGAIARFLDKFGEGVQQVEIDVTNVDRATEILRTRFRIEPIYPATRPGANGTRVNFFLVAEENGKKALVELVEQPGISS